MTIIFFIFQFFLLTKINSTSSQHLFDDHQLKLIDSINENLNIKNFIVVEDSLKKRDFNIISFTKHLSKEKIFASVINVEILKDLMQSLLNFPKTVVFPPEPNDNILKSIFTHENNFAHYRFRPIWLTFNDSYHKKFEGLFIPYNCQFLIAQKLERNEIIVKEIFHHKNEEKLYETYFGTWNVDQGFDVLQTDFYQERFNMNGTILYFLPMTPDGLCYGGYDCVLVKVIKMFSKMLNFRLEFLFSEELFDLFDNKSVNVSPVEGMLIEATISAVYPDNDWIGPFWKDSTYLYIAYDKMYQYRGIAPYFRPFSFNLWMFILAWLFLAGATSAVFKFLATRFEIRLFKHHSYLNVFFQLFETITNQECDGIPQNISSRIITLTGRFVGLFIMPAYCGALLSFIATPEFTYPFRDIFGLLATKGEYKLSLIFDGRQNASEEALEDFQWLASSNTDVLNLDIDGFPKSLDEAFTKVCTDHKLALVLGDIELWRVKTCRLLKIPEPFYTSWSVIFMPTHSPYKRIFSRVMTTLFSTGLLQLKGIPSYNRIVKETILITVDAVDFESLSVVFIMIGIIYAFSLGVLVAEKIFFKINLVWHGRKKTFIQVQKFFQEEQEFTREGNLGEKLKLTKSARMISLEKAEIRRAATAYN